ncbi:hypothetical protein ABT368_33640 [Streptomyces althioticus]|uniref:Uncharacterized protein n=2 Tax=Streptomyces althioticus group TaxID=2867194 RepID=A0ABR4SRW4_9ACTN|nr:hypothetical protein [Streptomyces griseorubens]KEG37938.1 hypothetical protein DJ64_24680 [Streptomyces griseorubens]WTC22466.1 hypothetical protein OG872_07200 [Streptomyces althioticus]GGT78106.1 hypothetical protein GCM10010243_65800 [Streptomyces matensis]
MTSPELSDLDYLREIERLANRVSVEASNEGWLSFQADLDGATPLQRSVNVLARALRHYHFEGDGCLDEDRPLVRLVGASVLKPGAMPAGVEEAYEEVCARIGVDPRPEGWALWNTWSDGDLKVTMVVSAVETTEGLFENWARGRALDPVSPLPSQIALVRQGWIGPVTFSPRGVKRTGLGGRPLF